MIKETNVHAAQDALVELRKSMGLNADGTHPSGVQPLGQSMAEAFKALPIPPVDELVWTCPGCGQEIQPLEVTTPWAVRKVRGGCPTCPPPWQAKEDEIKAQQAETDLMNRIVKYRALFPIRSMGALTEATFENFNWRPGVEAATAHAQRYAATLPAPDPVGILFWGDPGCGKSHLSVAIANNARDKRMAVAWVHLPTFLRDIGTKEADEREHLLKQAARADLLILDELGGGKLTTSRADWLLYLLDERYRHRRPVILTTNKQPDTLARALTPRREDDREGDTDDGARLVDRLQELCVFVHNEGTSYRAEVARRRQQTDITAAQ